jgi:DNA end-binding protein Ku
MIRASWKGHLKLAELTCAVGLYGAVSASDRVALHILNRKTGHRVRRQFVDQQTGNPVPTSEQAKGYDTGDDKYVVLSPDEIAAAVPENDKTLAIGGFIAGDDIDALYFDTSYYVAPTDAVAGEAFALLRQGMQSAGVAALASAVMFRRVRHVLLRPQDDGMVATLLSFDDEVRSAAEAFDGIPATRIEPEMLDLARHIIKTKTAAFQPETFEDRYEAALAELVKAKLAGRKPKPLAPVKSGTVVDLMQALRESAGAAAPAKPRRKPAAPRRTAG